MVEWLLVMLIGFLVLLLVGRAVVAVVVGVFKGLAWIARGGR